MVKEQFTMNMDKELKKTLRMIAIKEETNVTEIITGLLNNFLEVYDENKDNFYESINYAEIYKHNIKTYNDEKSNSYESMNNPEIFKRLERMGIEINDEGILFTGTFFNQLKISGKEIGEYIDEQKSKDIPLGLLMPLEK